MEKLLLTYVGEDSYFRPVYKDKKENLYKDTDPRVHVPASLYSIKGNSLEGELGEMLRISVKFVPKRKTW